MLLSKPSKLVASGKLRGIKKMSTKKYLIFSSAIVIIIGLCCLIAYAESSPGVKTDKNVYSTGETIQVSFFNASGSNSDWICIVPAGAPDNDAGNYQYLPSNVSQGVLTFEAPPPGRYEVRAYYNYSLRGYVVSARHSFSVAEKASSALPVALREEKPKPAESPAVMAFPAGRQMFNVAVFYFTPLSVEATGSSIAVTSGLANSPKIQSAFDLLGRKDLEVFLSSSNLQQNDRLDNVIEIGNKLGLNFVIAGTVDRRGAATITSCRIFSVAQRKIIFSHQFTSRGDAELQSNLAKLVDSIIDAIMRSN